MIGGICLYTCLTVSSCHHVILSYEHDWKECIN